jgi:hypothetical protein
MFLIFYHSLPHYLLIPSYFSRNFKFLLITGFDLPIVWYQTVWPMTQVRSDLKLPPTCATFRLKTTYSASASRFVRRHISVARSITNNPLLACHPSWTLCMTPKVEESCFLKASKKTVHKLYWYEPNIARMIPDWTLSYLPKFFAYCVELGPPTNGQTQTKGDLERGGERNIWIGYGERNRMRG